MHFKSSKFKVQESKLSVIRYPVLVILTIFALCSGLYASGLKDRVVAFVDNSAITLAELEMKYAETIKIKPDISKEEVLNTMINRVLLLREARKIYLVAPSEEELIKEYVDLKIRAFIRIREEKIKSFYEENIGKFEGKELDDVRDGIENYLIEDELNQLLKSHIDALRKATCVKIQLH